MQQAVLRYFPDSVVTYKYTNRTAATLFSRACFEMFQESVDGTPWSCAIIEPPTNDQASAGFPNVILTPEEKAWLAETCPVFSSEYLDYLEGFRYEASQVRIRYKPTPDDPNWGSLDIETVGPWRDSIMWEVPLLAALSEAYFQTVDTDWNYDGQVAQAYAKGRKLIEGGCLFNEFGTRRRRSLHAHDLVVEGLVQAQKEFGASKGAGKLLGTSNVRYRDQHGSDNLMFAQVYLARKHGLRPTGTVAQCVSQLPNSLSR